MITHRPSIQALLPTEPAPLEYILMLDPKDRPQCSISDYSLAAARTGCPLWLGKRPRRLLVAVVNPQRSVSVNE